MPDFPRSQRILNSASLKPTGVTHKLSSRVASLQATMPRQVAPMRAGASDPIPFGSLRVTGIRRDFGIGRVREEVHEAQVRASWARRMASPLKDSAANRSDLKDYQSVDA